MAITDNKTFEMFKRHYPAKREKYKDKWDGEERMNGLIEETFIFLTYLPDCGNVTESSERALK